MAAATSGVDSDKDLNSQTRHADRPTLTAEVGVAGTDYDIFTPSGYHGQLNCRAKRVCRSLPLSKGFATSC